jgi:hypothetical protein
MGLNVVPRIVEDTTKQICSQSIVKPQIYMRNRESKEIAEMCLSVFGEALYHEGAKQTTE